MTAQHEQESIKKAMKKTWILVVLGLVYIIVFLALALKTNLPSAPVEWDVGGKPFVPASSPYAEGYYLPVEQK